MATVSHEGPNPKAPREESIDEIRDAPPPITDEQLGLDYGHEIRAINQWTLQKLEVYKKYYPAFTSASKRAPSRYVAEAFCGPGKNLLGDSVIDGSALIALRTDPPFTKCLLMDISQKCVDALTVHAKEFGDRADVRRGDCNVDFAPAVADIVGPFDPCVCVLDPEDTTVAWSTIKALATLPRRRRKVEQLILFPTHTGFIRMLPVDGKEKPWAADKLTSMFGNDKWREIYQLRVANRISTDEATTRYVKLYAEGFQRLGYHVLDKEIRDNGLTGRLRYFLIFASEHPVGIKIMDDVFNRDIAPPIRTQPTLTQLSLFKPERRRRLDE